MVAWFPGRNDGALAGSSFTSRGLMTAAEAGDCEFPLAPISRLTLDVTPSTVYHAITGAAKTVERSEEGNTRNCKFKGSIASDYIVNWKRRV